MTRMPRKLLTAVVLSTVAALGACAGATAPAARAAAGNTKQPMYDDSATTADTAPASEPRTETVQTAAAASPVADPAPVVFATPLAAPAAEPAPAAPAPVRCAAGNTKQPTYDGVEAGSPVCMDNVALLDGAGSTL